MATGDDVQSKINNSYYALNYYYVILYAIIVIYLYKFIGDGLLIENMYGFPV